MVEMYGFFNILFTGQKEYARVKIINSVQDAYGHYIYLVGPDDTIYNWSNIVIMRKAK